MDNDFGNVREGFRLDGAHVHGGSGATKSVLARIPQRMLVGGMKSVHLAGNLGLGEEEELESVSLAVSTFFQVLPIE
jgi:hypothetical protein